MTLEDHKSRIEEFASKHGLTFEEFGEVGFGRECVGLAKGDSYVYYNPTRFPDHEQIPEYYNDDHYDIAPDDAYHKSECVAVLGHGQIAIVQLSEWVKALDDRGAVLVEYSNGATGMQAMLSGTKGYCFNINN